MQVKPLLKGLACAAACAALLQPAWAWPDKMVKLVTPAIPGGSTDVLARLVAEAITAETGHNAIVENKPGGAGSISVRALLAGGVDGQTLLVSANNLVSEAPLAIKTAFEPFSDVRPIAAIGQTCLMLVGHPSLQPRDLKSLVAHVKGQPGKISYASFSAGTVSHYAGLVLNGREGLDMQHVPFLGSPPGLAQVVGGQIPLMFDVVVSARPYVQAGKLVPYGYAGKTRSSFLPQVPTFAELGYPEMNFCNWTGIFAAGKVPDALVEKIHKALLKIADGPKFRERLAATGFEAMAPQTPAQLAQGLRADYERNAGILKAAGIKPAD